MTQRVLITAGASGIRKEIAAAFVATGANYCVLDIDPHALDDSDEHQSLKRFVDPSDIAALIVFITADAGKSISGQVLAIDNDAQAAA